LSVNDTDTPITSREVGNAPDWSPFNSGEEFRLADLLFRQVEMSAENINELCSIHDGLLEDHREVGPFASAQNMYDLIDSIQHGDAPWRCLKATVPYDGEDAPSWKKKDYDIWYRDPDVVLTQMIDNPDFDGEFDYAPYVELNRDGNRVWNNVMSGNYAWRQSVSNCRHVHFML
jgi:hypothetical protein